MDLRRRNNDGVGCNSGGTRNMQGEHVYGGRDEQQQAKKEGDNVDGEPPRHSQRSPGEAVRMVQMEEDRAAAAFAAYNVDEEYGSRRL